MIGDSIWWRYVKIKENGIVENTARG